MKKTILIVLGDQASPDAATLAEAASSPAEGAGSTGDDAKPAKVSPRKVAAARAKPAAVIQPHAFMPAFLAEAPLAGRQVGLARSASAGVVGSVDNGSPTAEASLPEQTPEAVLATLQAWNPLSWSGVRSLWQDMENRLDGRVDELVVLVDPPDGPEEILAWAARDIERAALSYGNGLAALLQEAVRRFDAAGGGTILLVLCGQPLAGGGPARAGLRALALAAGAALAENLLEQALPAGCRFAALRDESGQADLLARHVIRLLTDWPKDSGKLGRFTGKSGLFGRF